jgi:hypothetical protein
MEQIGQQIDRVPAAVITTPATSACYTAMKSAEETIMLGEKLGEFRGKVTGQRVLPAVGGRPTLETSFEISGTILGINATMMGTYWSTTRPDGTLYGECPQQGVLMTQDGEPGTWSGTGVGRFTGHGSAVSFRGTLYFQTTSPKPARLNGMAVLYEWDVGGHGKAQTPLWEWK